MLYHRFDSTGVMCDLCAHRCRIRDGRRGLCGVRVNHGGVLYTLVYDRVAAVEVDPIEKKPLYHFQPGSASLSVATVGCNMKCLNCQNYTISQASKAPRREIVGRAITPGEIVKTAKARRCRSISYTYTEPTVFFELVYETALLARANGLKNVFVTNGYLTREAIRTMAPCLDAANIDLKGFDDRRYRRVNGARLKPVLDAIRYFHRLGIWIEITTLVIPGHNDSDGELRAIAEFLASISFSIPWHVSAFFPAYKMSGCPPSPTETLYRAYTIGRSAGLHYVYCGNIPGEIGSCTYCHQCHTKLIERLNHAVLANRIVRGHCPECQTPILGVALSGDRLIPRVA